VGRGVLGEVIVRRYLVLVVVLLVVSACGSSDSGSTSTEAAPSTSAPAGGEEMPVEIEQLLDDYLRAWEEKDEAAIRAATTNDFVITEYIYEESDVAGTTAVELYEHISDDIDGVVRQGFRYDWENEQVGQALVTGDGPWVVSVEENWIYYNRHYDGTANYVIVEEDGSLKIANHYWSGFSTLVFD
jgi:hypothetical protein